MSSDTANPPKTTTGISRRQALKGTAAAAAGVAIGSGAISDTVGHSPISMSCGGWSQRSES
jgi:hypothetical protein